MNMLEKLRTEAFAVHLSRCSENEKARLNAMITGFKIAKSALAAKDNGETV